jgi:predicted 3-demethylubiquinone-9 3-methyltransferase (glyoxalase superfamily)
MKAITPHLWFDKEAAEAAELYVSSIANSRIKSVRTIYGTPSGDCDIVSFELAGQPFMAISAGPFFRFNPSVSFQVKRKTVEELNAMWQKLSEKGRVRLPVAAYPFSERYGWTEDRYGLSWQLMLAGGTEIKQKITPVLTFVDKVCGKAEEAVHFYASVFKDPPPRILARYGKGEEPEHEGTTRYAQFILRGQEFGAMDSAREHKFAFNEAISFVVSCDTQEEIDYCWETLSDDPNGGQCGWLKDKYGLSWQITPTIMDQMLGSGDPQRLARVTQAFLKMKRFNISELQRAFDGK